MTKCVKCDSVSEVKGMCMKCYKKEWNDTNRSHLNEYSLKWYHANKTLKQKTPMTKKQIAERQKKWAEINQDKIAEYQANQYSKDACDILTSHADELRDDPERLSTDFICGLIAGDDADG